jgi:hypothetical protein
MMRRAWFGWVIFCALAVTLGCRKKPSPDWNGTWKLNVSKSNYQRLLVTISISADGEFRYEAAGSSFTFPCDGKDRSIGKNRTQSCVKDSATTLDLTRKENGTKTNTYHWELSADGKVLTAVLTAFTPSGPVVTSRNVASRVSGSSGFAGQWHGWAGFRQLKRSCVVVDCPQQLLPLRRTPAHHFLRSSRSS